jgi:glycosyltransferase involved in cell wall biosynthesis
MSPADTDRTKPEREEREACPLVTIGLPVFNGERHLRAALESLVAQSYRNLEILISDNASTDRTAAICREFAAADPRVRYSRNECNIGGFRNHDLLVERATGTYFMWAGHDDVRAPDCVRRCVEVLEREPDVVLCFTTSVTIDGEGIPIPARGTPPDASAPRAADRFHDLIRMDHLIEPIYGLMRLDVLRKTPLLGQYPDSDRVLVAELALHGPFRRIPEPLFFRRDHPGRSTRLYPSRRMRMAWISPASGRSFALPHARQFVEYIRAIRRAPIGAGDRLRCLGYMAAWLEINRKRLARDFIGTAREFARTLGRRTRGPGGAPR